MSNDKYYTPSIEEFHVGFEYEYLAPSGQWVPFKCYEETPDGKIEWRNLKRSDLKDVRVKYLDREDIESLGFKEWVKDKLPGETLRHPYDQFTEASNIVGINTEGKSYGATIFYGNTVDPQYIRIEGAIAPGPVYGYIGGHPLFRGTIKNKSELKILLKQLGI